MTQIGIEYIAANALLELDTHCNIRDITIRHIYIYADRVIEEYNAHNKPGVELVDTPGDIENLVLEYPDYFELDGQVLKIHKDADIEEMKHIFRWSLTYAMIIAISEISIRQVIKC